MLGEAANSIRMRDGVLILGDVSVIGPGRWRSFESGVPPSTGYHQLREVVVEVDVNQKVIYELFIVYGKASQLWPRG